MPFQGDYSVMRALDPRMTKKKFVGEH